MDSEAKHQGRAVTETVTLEVLTLPDGSKRDVFSRPVGDSKATVEWLKKRQAENPNAWMDLRDYYRAIYFGEPPKGKIDRAIRKTLRTFIRAAKNEATSQGLHIEDRRDNVGGVTHFRLADLTNPQTKNQAINTTSKDRRMENAWHRRVDRKCLVIGTDVEQLDAIIAAQNKQNAATV